jgi:hypothetical protein
MKFFAEISVECNKSIVYNFFASYHGSGLWDAHFAKNNGAIRQFLIHMEGLRAKRETQDFSPLAQLSALVRVLLNSLDKTTVYEFTNIDRNPLLKPNVKPVRDIKSFHCFQFVDAHQMDCNIMCGDTFFEQSVTFTSGPLTRSEAKETESSEDEIDSKYVDVSLNDAKELELDVDDDQSNSPSPSNSPPTSPRQAPKSPLSSSPIASRVKRNRTSRTTFTSSYGDDYCNIDDLDLG